MTVCYCHATYKLQSESTFYKLCDCQVTPYSKQALYLKFMWLQRDSNPQPLSLLTNTQPFSQNGLTIELYCEYLSVWCIWLYVIIMSRTSFSVNQNSIVCLNVTELLAQIRHHIWSFSDSGCGFESRCCHLNFMVPIWCNNTIN